MDYLRSLHRDLFLGIRSFAGQVRRPGYGSEVLRFGPNRSVHSFNVESELAAAMETVRRSVLSVLDNPEAEAREESTIHIAVWAHAEVVRIHPFEDGNGRTSRLLLDAILVHLGLRPIPIEEVRQTYYDCLNRFMAPEREIDPILDLYIRLAAEQLE